METVTIPLDKYLELRDQANEKIMLIDGNTIIVCRDKDDLVKEMEGKILELRNKLDQEVKDHRQTEEERQRSANMIALLLSIIGMMIFVSLVITF